LVEISWNRVERIVKNLLGLKICENTRRIEPVSSKIFLKLTKTDKIVKLLVLSYVHQENKIPYVYTSLNLLIPSFTEFKIQEILAPVREKAGNYPVVTIKAINLCTLQLEKEAEQYRKAKEIETEQQEEQALQLDYLRANTESLEEALRRGSTIGIAEAYRELVLKLERLRAGLQATIWQSNKCRPRWNLNLKDRLHLQRYAESSSTTPGRMRRRPQGRSTVVPPSCTEQGGGIGPSGGRD
jgi:hypothetical protein